MIWSEVLFEKQVIIHKEYKLRRERTFNDGKKK